MAAERVRGERLQIMLSPQELALIDDFRFAKRMPSRAASVRELFRRGLAAEGFLVAPAGQRSKDFGVAARPRRDVSVKQRTNAAPVVAPERLPRGGGNGRA
jgi:hypothetical protein